ncbi:MAG TPA: hypothetical protein VHU86_11130 [Solirubrobacterales bacterium]|jgi:hypothetical protein|nr:hypothetical protein [Solirubrobacterales bacterium]
MSFKHPMGRRSADGPSPSDEDTRVEAAILTLLLDEYPAQITIPELSLALNNGGGGFDCEDAVERGVRELVGAGLLHCQGAFVQPARPLLYLQRLELS